MLSRAYKQPPWFLTLVLLLALRACTSPPPDAQTIIDKAILAHGGDQLDGKRITFDFRGRQFVAEHEGGRFQYERIYTTDTTGVVREILNNDGFFREIDGVRGEFDDEFMRRMETSVNSVIYFALLPYKLNDPAVIKTYLGTAELEGQPYYKVEIRFQEEGGGRDYQDWFVYWIHQDAWTMDYLSYYYFTDDEGARFRKVVNSRMIGDFRLTDHINYKADYLGREVDRFDEAFSEGKVEQVSEVILENIEVTPLQ